MVCSDHYLDKLSLKELAALLVKKTTEYIELAEQKCTGGIKLRDLKNEIDNLHSVIIHKKSLG